MRGEEREGGGGDKIDREMIEARGLEVNFGPGLKIYF
jgi:hypothetical protein